MTAAAGRRAAAVADPEPRTRHRTAWARRRPPSQHRSRGPVRPWTGRFRCWSTASTSFANPAVTIGRTLTNTYAGIAPGLAPAFIAAQPVGAILGRLLAVVVHPITSAPAPADTPPSSPDNPAEAPAMADIPEVLFVCTHNAGRSQMAAALLDQRDCGERNGTGATAAAI